MVNKMLLFDYKDTEKDYFKSNKFDYLNINFFESSLNNETLLNLTTDDFENTMILSVFVTSVLTRDILSKFKNLRIISTRSTGFDNIDLDYCVDKNIAVINVPSYGHITVSNFTIMTMLMLLRNIKTPLIKNSFDNKDYETGKDLNNLTIGIVGGGAIGASVCNICSYLGSDILVYDKNKKEELVDNKNVKYVELENLFTSSDIVSIHLPYTTELYHFINYKYLSLMKENSYFINVSRKELVDINDLYSLVKKGKFKGVALDPILDFSQSNESNTIIEMSKMDNIIITPHIAYNTKDAINYILTNTFKGISDYLTGSYNYRII